MTGPPAAPWRLRIRATARDGGAVLGSGFLILPDTALTCAHVVTENDGTADVLVDLAAGGANGIRATAAPLPGWRGDMSRDLAVLTLAAPVPFVPPAVLADGESPQPGAALSAFGFPAGFGAPGRGRRPDESMGPGVWAAVTAQGVDFYGRLLQCQSTGPHGVPVASGFSGGPVVDERTGAVVAMTAFAKQEQRISYCVLARTLRERLPLDIAARLDVGSAVPPALTRAVAALNRRGPGGRRAPDFDTARICLAPLLQFTPEHPDVAYYAALTALGGRRPRNPAVGDALARIDRRFRAAYEEGTASAHLLALWAVLKEDGFIGRGLGDRQPYAEELRHTVTRTSIAHADEICALVPAPETPTWEQLDRRRLQ
ncbi:S1 family peptidase [Streptomyces hiroshimensis]|uniref:Serine protease n=1 Tax=Streptomyces hiroshimensis TaxID=66424 RepID=A0ABQ2Z9H9_9ACTN|nr:serine protease [Streptomyces hiroshimensis]GGY05713.1 hypothetical protein GCM10010324_60670 [Streptomyces hiroshimensis]